MYVYRCTHEKIKYRYNIEPLLFIEVLSQSCELRAKFPKLLGAVIVLCKLRGVRLLAVRVVPATYLNKIIGRGCKKIENPPKNTYRHKIIIFHYLPVSFSMESSRAQNKVVCAPNHASLISEPCVSIRQSRDL